MAERTDIESTDATWNPITGCSVTSPGCRHCYAMRLAGGRLKHHPSRRGLTKKTDAGPVWNGEVRFNEHWLTAPLRWRKPRRIFVCAHSDLFHPAVPDEWIDRVYAVMALAPRHVFQVLTKRPERMADYFSNDSDSHMRMVEAGDTILWQYGGRLGPFDFPWSTSFPLDNVWLGVSVEDFERTERILHLRETPAALRFVSFETLLGDIGPVDLRGIGWAILGGESGPRARCMEPDWARAIRDLCLKDDVGFFFKQWGGPRPKSAARLLDGVLYDSIPERLSYNSWFIALQGRNTDIARPCPYSPALMFDCEDDAFDWGDRLQMSWHTDWDVSNDPISRQCYLVKYRYKGLIHQRLPSWHLHQVLCADGCWRDRHRVLLPNGQLAPEARNG